MLLGGLGVCMSYAALRVVKEIGSTPIIHGSTAMTFARHASAAACRRGKRCARPHRGGTFPALRSALRTCA